MRSFTSKSLTMMRGKLLFAGLMISMLALVVSCGGGGGGGDTTVTVTETGAVTLSGTVYSMVNSGLTPVEGATVSVFSDQYTTMTGADGTFSLKVNAAPHTMIVSKSASGLSDSFQFLNLTNDAGKILSEPLLLTQEPSGLPKKNGLLASESHVIISNIVNGNSATLNVAAQSTEKYSVGTETLARADFSLQYFDIHEPLPFPLPYYKDANDTNIDSSLTFSAARLAPISVVSVKPLMIDLESNAATTLMIPNPTIETPQILRYDHQNHKWVGAGVGTANANGTTTFAITAGGLYGIFQETGTTVGAISGALPFPAGTQVFVGDQVINIGNDGRVNSEAVHLPYDDTPLDVIIVDYSTSPPTVTKSSVTMQADSTAAVTMPGDPDTVTLGFSQASVKTDNSDSTTITATVLSSNVGVEGAIVSFSSTGGEISDSSLTTDVDGKAAITFSSGEAVKKNQVVTITASLNNLSRSIPIQVTGTTVSLSAANTNIEVGEVITMTATVKDAGGNTINNADVSVSASDSSVTLSPGSGTTGIDGTVSFDITGVTAGTVDVQVSSLGAAATQTYTVSTQGASFGVSSATIAQFSSTTEPYSWYKGFDLPIIVNDPSLGDVTFVTSLGTWKENGKGMYTGDASTGTVSATLQSSMAGMAEIQVIDAESMTTATIISDSIQTAFSAPIADAAIINLHASATIIAPSAVGATNSLELVATVETVDNQVVGNAPVRFYMSNPVGGGETILPVVAFTDDFGVAKATFYSGTLSSGGQGITVYAEVMGSTATINDSQVIIIGGTAGSIVMGRGTKAEEVDVNNYKLPISLMLTDSSGQLVKNADVSISVWPKKYNTGYWVQSLGEECVVANFEQFDNEDSNRNLQLDSGEDSGNNPGNGDGALTPPNAAAGGLSDSIVNTGDTGIVNVDLFYPKHSSVWIDVELKATAVVLGSETTSNLTFTLPYIVGDSCFLPHSPYNSSRPVASMTVVATPSTIPADGTTLAEITATAYDITGKTIDDDTTLTFAVTTGTGTLVTNSAKTLNGSASVTYTASDTAGQEAVTVTAPSGVEKEVIITLDSEKVDSITFDSASPSTSVPASGVDTIQLTFEVLNNANPAVAVANQLVSFTAAGSKGGSPIISPASALTDSSGQVTVTINDTTAETVTVTATAVDKSATQDIVFTALPPANITLESTVPDPAVVSISGVGKQETATLTFKLVDTLNNPVQGSYLVDFSIVSGGLNGGEYLTVSQSSSNSSSLVSTIFQAGSFSGTVQVRASLHDDPSILADVTVSVTGGLPAGNSLGLSSIPLNIAGRKIAGLTQDIALRASDYFSNPVVPGTQVTFQTDYAAISETGSFTTDTDGNSSTSTAVITSGSNPPVDGFVTMAAQTIGGSHSKVLSLAVKPDDADTIYAGTDGGGIFKTIDGGTTWIQVGSPLKDINAAKFTNLTGSVVRDLVIDSNNTSVVYAATDKGVFVSTDAGGNWKSLTGLHRKTGDNLGTLPAGSFYGNDGLLSIGVSGSDGGSNSTTTFTSASADFIDAGVQAGDMVRILSGNDIGTYYVASDPVIATELTLTSVIAGNATSLKYEVITGTVFLPFTFQHSGVRSRTKIMAGGVEITNYAIVNLNGVKGVRFFNTSFSILAPGMTITADYDVKSTLPDKHVYAVAINPDSSKFDLSVGHASEIYVGIYGDGVWKTIDGGRNWTKASAMAAGQGVSFGDKVLTLAVNSQQSNEIFAGTDGDGLFWSNDSGATWYKLEGGIPAAGSDGVSAANATFTSDLATFEASGVAEGDILKILSGNDTGDYIITAVTDTQLTLTTDLTDSEANLVYYVVSFSSMLNETEVHDILIEPRAGWVKKIWVGGRNGIHYSIDGGASWTKPSTDVNAADVSNLDVRKLARDTFDGTLYAITFGDILDNYQPHGGVYSSPDGDVWTLLSDVRVTGADKEAGAHALDALAVVGSATPDGDTIIVGSEGRSVWKSTDSGASWNQANGNGQASLTNTLFSAAQVMHSGSTFLDVIPLTASFQPMDDKNFYANGYGSFSSIYNTETQAFYVRVADALGNRLVSGTTISANVSAGKLTGNTSETLADGVYYDTDFLLYWNNNSTSTEDITADLTVAVTSENGSGSVTLSRSLIAALNVDPAAVAINVLDTDPANTTYSKQITVKGGSNVGYTYTNVLGSASVGSTGLYTYTYPGGLTAGSEIFDTVIITDVATGEQVEVEVTITVTAGSAEPVPSFTAAPTGTPLQMQFTDTSTTPDGSINGWLWDFNSDGAWDAHISNPTYTFPASGDYDVRLMVTNDKGGVAEVTQTITVP